MKLLEYLKDGFIRKRLLAIFGLLALIGGLLYFDIQQGFMQWENVNSNLSLFVAINANIILLAVLFYLVLRNLLKLLYERKQRVLGVHLKTKLTIAFLILSLPATLFHLFASGFISNTLERWLAGQHETMVQSSQVVIDAYQENLQTLMQTQAVLLKNILQNHPEYLNNFSALNQVSELQSIEGVGIYDANEELRFQALRTYKANKYWSVMSEEEWLKVREQEQAWLIRDLGNRWLFRYVSQFYVKETLLLVEVFYPSTKTLTGNIQDLSEQANNSRIFSESRELIKQYYFLIFTLMTFAIAFVAVWLALYLARGVVQPITQLADATKRVSEGELGFQIESRKNIPIDQDFGLLVSSFNAMSQQLLQNRTELQQHTRFVELVLENIKTGVMSLDLDGNITSLNRAAKTLLQLTSPKYLNKPFQQILEKESLEVFEKLWEALLPNYQKSISENWTLIKYGVPLHIAITLLVLENTEGEPVGVVAVYENITEIQRFQRAQAWRDVARRIAHEIKNPLTPIQLGAQQIRRKYLYSIEDGEVLDNATQTIIEEVEILKKMVKEFSRFARMPESNPQPCNLNPLIEETLMLYESVLPENIRLSAELDPHVPMLSLDREQIKRVLLNLVDNAVDAISREGQIQIQTKYQPDQNQVQLVIQDEGVGVPTELLDRLFEPYATTKVHGTGLGLSIVAQIVSDHHGTIRHRNRERGGSCFTIEFPVS